MRTLKELKAACSTCTECGLHKKRHNVVFGSGNPNARILFVNDFPNYIDDKYGVPMLGDDGRIFNAMLSTFGITRNQDMPDECEIFVANAVMCHPGRGREGQILEPSKRTINTCKHWLEETIYAIDPIVVVAMGKAASISLVGSGAVTQNIGSLHIVDIPGVFKPIRVPVVVIPNPAFLVRDNNNDSNGYSAWTKWTLQELFRQADAVAFDRYGETTRHAPKRPIEKPDRVPAPPYLAPDEPDVDDIPERLLQAFDWED